MKSETKLRVIQIIVVAITSILIGLALFVGKKGHL
jgi:hypothetical protein